VRYNFSKHPKIFWLFPGLFLVTSFAAVLIVINIENSKPVNLWSPSGEWIVFSCGLDDRRELFLVRPDGSNLYQLTNNTISDNAPRWSPDGEWIAFYAEKKDIQWISADNDAEIYIIRPDGSDQRRLTSNKRRDVYPDWSPDGQSIIFVSDRASEGFPSSNDIYTTLIASG
jgi:Tol biopolymer transport system component